MAYQGLIEVNVHSVNFSSMTKTTLGRIFILTMSITVDQVYPYNFYFVIIQYDPPIGEKQRTT